MLGLVFRVISLLAGVRSIPAYSEDQHSQTRLNNPPIAFEAVTRSWSSPVESVMAAYHFGAIGDTCIALYENQTKSNAWLNLQSGLFSFNLAHYP